MLRKSFVAVLVIGSMTAVFAQAPAFKRTVLQTVEMSIAGREAVTAKAELPGGVSSGRHTHPGEEIGYVLAARFDKYPAANSLAFSQCR